MKERPTLESLLLELLEWVKKPRSYAEIMEAWRTSCPRLPVWEEAIDRGLLKRTTIDGRSAQIVLTEAGRRFLRDSRVLGGATAAERCESSLGGAGE